MKPGTRWLLLACLLSLPLVFSSPVRRLQGNLYDAQLRLTRAMQGRQSLDSQLAILALDDRAARAGLDQNDLEQARQQLGPGAELARGPEMGPFFQADEDGTIRAVTLVRRTGDGLELSPPVRHLLAARGLTPDQVSWDGCVLRFGRTRIPTDAEGRIYPLFPLTELQTGEVQGLVSAAGVRTLTEALTGSARMDVLTPGSLLELPQVMDLLKGKVVVLGIHQKIADELELPTPTGNMVSLELYASVMDGLLTGITLRPLPLWGNVLLTMLFLVLLCHLLPGKRTAAAIGTWLAGVASWFALGLSLCNAGVFAQLAPALVMSATALFLHVLLRARRLALTLEGLGGGELGRGEEKEVTATILFTNLPAAIKEMERSAPEQGQKARNAYARCLGKVVGPHRGRVVDQQGDAQMLAFGLEGEPHHDALALACALDIVTAVERMLSDELGTERSSGPRVFCGVVTGTVASGQVGGGSYRSVAAIGDTTNAAARLMGQAEKRGIPVLASRTTTETQGPRLECRSAGEISLRGRQEPLQVDEVVSFHSPPRPLALKPRTDWPRAAVLWLAGAVVLATAAAVVLDGLLPLREALLDAVTPSRTRARLVFAGVDEESLSVLPWPWPRALHAQAIENCRKAGVSCLFYDIIFDRASDSPADDQALAGAVRAGPMTVLATAVGNGQEPELIEGLLDSDSWGLINAPTDGAKGDRRMRQALWQWGDLPGASQAIARRIAPDLLSQLRGETEFLIRWGPAPETISYSRLVDPADPIQADLKGAVVVVGDNTQGTNDAFETPYGLRKGSFIHAQAIQTMLTSQVLLDRSRGWPALLLALVTAAVTALLAVRSTGPGHQITILVAMLVGSLLLVVALLPAGYFMGARGMLAVPCALLLGISLKAMGLSQALLRYVPARLQQRLETEDSVPDKEVWATVMVTDIRGYTTLSEKRTPLEILRLLNHYHEVTARCYESLGGHLLTYQGDAQIVVFGALEPLGSPVLSAIRAAERLPFLVAEVARGFQLGEHERLSVGAGIATGKMTLVLLRAGEQLQYTVLGEPIRRAHGLQSLSDELGSSLLLDPESAREVGDILTSFGHTSASGISAYTLGGRPEGSPPG